MESNSILKDYDWLRARIVKKQNEKNIKTYSRKVKTNNDTKPLVGFNSIDKENRNPNTVQELPKVFYKLKFC